MGKRSRRAKRQASDNNAASLRLTFDPPTTRVRFPLGAGFPADDAVGHLVLGLAAAMNDLNLLNSLLFPPDDPDRNDFAESERVTLTRMLLGAVWEVHLLVARADKIADVSAFIDELARAYPKGKAFSGEQLVAVLRGRDGATAPQLRNVLRVARNSTFHYAAPGDDDLRSALEDLAGEAAVGEFVYGSRMPSVRADFAELVQLRVALRELEPPDETGMATLFAALSQTVVAIVHLAQVAIDLWLSSRPDVSVEKL